MRNKINVTRQSFVSTGIYDIDILLLYTLRTQCGVVNLGDIIIDRNYNAFEVTDITSMTIDGNYNRNIIVTRLTGTFAPGTGTTIALIYEVLSDTNVSNLPGYPMMTVSDYSSTIPHKNTVNNLDNLRANTGIGDAGMNTIQNTDKIYLPVMENELITTEFDEDFIFETNITSTDWTELWTYTVDISEIDPAKYNKSVKSMFGYFRLHGNVANPGETAELKVIVLDNDELTQNDVTNIFTVDSTDVMDWIRSGTMKFTESLVMPFKLRVVGRITSGSGTLTASISNQTNVDLTYVVDKI